MEPHSVLGGSGRMACQFAPVLVLCLERFAPAGVATGCDSYPPTSPCMRCSRAAYPSHLRAILGGDSNRKVPLLHPSTFKVPSCLLRRKLPTTSKITACVGFRTRGVAKTSANLNPLWCSPGLGLFAINQSASPGRCQNATRTSARWWTGPLFVSFLSRLLEIKTLGLSWLIPSPVPCPCFHPLTVRHGCNVTWQHISRLNM